MDRDHWHSIVTPASTQSGKTFAAFIIPLAYWISELRENYVCGLPDMNMAQDKWQIDIRPVFDASPRLSELLPTRGPGSKGGSIKNTVTFANNVVLRFMSAGGDDEKRAAFTARGFGITEAKAFSYAAPGSHEGTQLDQIRGRLLAHKRHRRREHIEGTVSIASELPWALRDQSTRSRLLVPCPHCGRWICCEREHLYFDQRAETEEQAAETAEYHCPECGQAITDSERRTAVQDVTIVHDGQTIDRRGRIRGEPPNTRRLWFRWNCFLNLFQDAGDVAIQEWKRSRFGEDDPDGEEQEKVACQQFWAIPFEPRETIWEKLNQGEVAERQVTDLPKGQLPADTDCTTVFVDVGMYRCYWVGIAWRTGGAAHIYEYGSFSVLAKGGEASDRQQALEIVLRDRLKEFCQRCLQGWPVVQAGKVIVPARVWIDCGYKPDIVHSVVRAMGDPARFKAHVGRGTGQTQREQYRHPKKKTNDIRLTGERYYLTKHEKHRHLYVIADSDYWKGWLHRRLKSTEGPGALTLFRDVENQPPHKTFDRHLRSESLEQEIHPKHGPIYVFRNTSGRVNHYLDAAYGACVAGHHAGFRLLVEDSEAQSKDKGKQWSQQRKQR